MTATRPILGADEIWRTYDAMEARLTAPLSQRMVELAGIGPGMRVLDLATGRGEPAIAAAQRVGPSGYVLGLDVSDSMLTMARERADQIGLSNLDLRVMNAASFDVGSAARFDATLIRWGLMYMDSPVAALIRARRAMKAGAALVAVLWAEPERVPYYTMPRRLLGRYRSVPAIDFTAPGPFYYADVDRLREDFLQAELLIEHIEELDLPVMEAETAADLIAWVRAFGLTRLLNELPEHDQDCWERALAQEAESLRVNGVFRLGGVSRIVVARGISHWG